MKIDYTREKDILAALNAGKLKVIKDGDDRHMMVTRRSNSRSTEVEHILGGTTYRVPNEIITNEEPCIFHHFDETVCSSKCLMFDSCKKYNGISRDRTYLEHLHSEIIDCENSIVNEEILNNALISEDVKGKEVKLFIGLDGKYHLFRYDYPTSDSGSIAAKILKKEGVEKSYEYEEPQVTLKALYDLVLLNKTDERSGKTQQTKRQAMEAC